MDSFINLDKAKEVLENGVEQAASLLKDNEKINGVLTNVQAKIKEVPVSILMFFASQHQKNGHIDKTKRGNYTGFR